MVKSNKYLSVFISYSHKDKDFAHWLFNKLKNQGVRCWLDEKNIKIGERILDSINSGISSHDRILLCCSQESLESWWVQDEIRKIHEIERQKNENRIIPILLDKYLLDEWNNGLASDLRSRLGVSFLNWKPHKTFDMEFSKIMHALQQ